MTKCILIIIQIFNIIMTLIKKKDDVADPNPWRATTLEWGCSSPPIAHGNFEKELSFLYVV